MQGFSTRENEKLTLLDAISLPVVPTTGNSIADSPVNAIVDLVAETFPSHQIQLLLLPLNRGLAFGSQ